MLGKWRRDIHWPLVYATTALACLGILSIYSATHQNPGHYEVRQLFWTMVGFCVFFAVPFLGYRTFLSVSYLFYLVTLFLLVWVLVAGETRLGAQRWISIGPVALQPSEFAKMSTVMVLAHFLGSHNAWEKDAKIILSALAMGLLPFFLIVKQPDLGSSILFIPIIIASLYLWGIRYRYLIISAILGGIGIPFFWLLLREYQKKRVLVFLNPKLDPLGAGYTALQSRIAVGSGGMIGKGYLAGTQSQLDFVPEHHTDFIFCVLGEEWGFLGTSLLILCYGFLFHSIFQVIHHTTDLKAKLLATGVVTLLFSQVFVNVGMSIGLMPVTGITLPLVSYGGSSFLTTAFALGLVLSIHKERSIF